MNEQTKTNTAPIDGYLAVIASTSILCAAIWIDNGNKYEGHFPKNIENGFVVCGHRHHNCFSILSLIWNTETERIAVLRNAVQGFLTSDNRFVNRKEAGQIAFNSGQIVKPTDCLFSEDLY